jgi:hypothetical protein
MTTATRRAYGLALILITAACLLGCPSPRPPEPPPEPGTELAAAVRAKVEAERLAAVAVRTSRDATAAAQDARQDAAAARALADEKDGQAKALEATARTLRSQEIASRLSTYAWWLVGIGALSGLAGLAMMLYLPGKVALAVATLGGSVAALGLLGLWLAPWWLTIAWVAGAVVAVAAIGGLLWAVHEHSQGLHSLWDKTQDEAAKDPRLAKLLRKAGVIP